MQSTTNTKNPVNLSCPRFQINFRCIVFMILRDRLSLLLINHGEPRILIDSLHIKYSSSLIVKVISWS